MRSPDSAFRQIVDGVVLVVLVAGIMGLWRDCALAQDALPPLPDIDAPCAPEVTENRRATLMHDGVSGTWLHPAVIRCMLGRVNTLPLYASRVRLLEQERQISDERTELLRRGVALAEEAEQRVEAILETAERRAREAVEEMNAWWRSPILWFAAGGVVIGAVMALGAWGLSAIAAAVP